MTQLAGAHVLVTGGSSGIGLATAARAVERGAAVSIVARDQGRLSGAGEFLLAEGAPATRVATASADVTDAAALSRVVERLVATMGPVDVLVTSAGEAHPGHFVELPDDVFRAQMEVDYFGTLHAAREVVPSMIERRRANAELYRARLKGVPIRLPQQKPYEFHTFVNFVSQCDRRDELQKHLASNGVQTVVHYNTPIHLQPAAASLGARRGQFPMTERLCGRILALPANQTLSEEDLRYVAGGIRGFFKAA